MKCDSRAGLTQPNRRNHEAGNVGVEHASPDTLRAMLRRARPSFGTGRTEFSLDELRGAGLFGDWQDKEKVGGAGQGVWCTVIWTSSWTVRDAGAAAAAVRPCGPLNLASSTGVLLRAILPIRVRCMQLCAHDGLIGILLVWTGVRPLSRVVPFVSRCSCGDKFAY